MAFESRMKINIFINKDIEQIVKAKQNDALSRYLEVTLLDDVGAPYDLTGCRIQFNAKKADGAYIMNNATVTEPERGKCEIELTDQTLAIGDSVVTADISIFSDDANTILTTRTFIIKVQATVRDDEATESSSEYNSVVVLFQDVWAMREVIRSIDEKFGKLSDGVEDGGEQAGPSALGALNNIWNYLRTQSTAGIVETITGIITLINERSDIITQLLDRANSILGQESSPDGSSGTVMNFLETMYTRGIVKSFQRGTTSSTSLNIAEVNPKKCIVLLNNGVVCGHLSTNTSTVSGAYVSSIAEKTLSLKINANSSGTTYTAGWQVIEFY